MQLFAIKLAAGNIFHIEGYKNAFTVAEIITWLHSYLELIKFRSIETIYKSDFRDARNANK